MFRVYANFWSTWFSWKLFGHFTVWHSVTWTLVTWIRSIQLGNVAGWIDLLFFKITWSLIQSLFSILDHFLSTYAKVCWLIRISILLLKGSNRNTFNSLWKTFFNFERLTHAFFVLSQKMIWNFNLLWQYSMFECGASCAEIILISDF